VHEGELKRELAWLGAERGIGGMQVLLLGHPTSRSRRECERLGLSVVTRAER